jgi:hypothetical protein
LHPFSFFLFSLLLQPWIQALYWLRVERVGHPCLISDLGKMFSFFTIQYNFSSQFVTYNVYQIEVQSFFFYFFSVFLSWRDVGFCHGLFLIYWGDHEIFFPILFMCGVTFIDLHVSSHPCISWSELDSGAWSF